MVKRCEYKGHVFWITIDEAMNTQSGQGGYIAYVSDTEPTYLVYGTAIRQGEQLVIFGDQFAALTNARILKQGEIDRM